MTAHPGVLALALLAVAMPSSDAARYASPGILADVHGRHINFYCTGRGNRTVVLESGLGGRASTWLSVQPALKNVRSCSYDRAGYGFSDAGPEPRTSKNIAADLYDALRSAHIPPPYVLVATSFGAFDVRIFAHDHPHDVAAMVLLNPAHEDEELHLASAPIEKIDRDGLGHARTCLRAARDGMLGPGKPLNKTCVPPPMPAYPHSLNDTRTAQLQKPKFWSALVSEWTHIRTSAAQVKALDERLGGLPLVVVSAGKNVVASGQPPDVTRALDEFWPKWVRWQDQIAALSSNSEHIRVNSSSRMVETTDPQIAVHGIQRALAMSAHRQSRSD